MNEEEKKSPSDVPSTDAASQGVNPVSTDAASQGVNPVSTDVASQGVNSVSTDVASQGGNSVVTDASDPHKVNDNINVRTGAAINPNKANEASEKTVQQSRNTELNASRIKIPSNRV